MFSDVFLKAGELRNDCTRVFKKIWFVGLFSPEITFAVREDEKVMEWCPTPAHRTECYWWDVTPSRKGWRGAAATVMVRRRHLCGRGDTFLLTVVLVNQLLPVNSTRNRL